MTALMGSRRRALIVPVLAVALSTIPVALALGQPPWCVPDPNARWCATTFIRTWVDVDLYNDSEWRSVIFDAINTWNRALQERPGAPRLDPDLQPCAWPCATQCATSCIFFQLQFGSDICAFTGPPVTGVITKKIIVFGEGMGWSRDKKYRTALHEIGHALGMGHVDDFFCAVGPQLMNEGYEYCNVGGSTIDYTAENGLDCLYGNAEGTCQSKWGLVTSSNPFRLVEHVRSNCYCGVDCATAKARAVGLEQGVTFELAISETGGPYTVYADSLTAADWIDDRYTHTFDRPYRNALIRMRVFDDTGELVDQATTVNPIDILLTPTDVSGGPIAPDFSRALPNPFRGATDIVFELGREEHVELCVYDVAGRKVGTLVNQSLRAGLHRVRFDPISIGAGTVKSGIYVYSIRTETRFEKGKMLLVR